MRLMLISSRKHSFIINDKSLMSSKIERHIFNVFHKEVGIAAAIQNQS